MNVTSLLNTIKKLTYEMDNFNTDTEFTREEYENSDAKVNGITFDVWRSQLNKYEFDSYKELASQRIDACGALLLSCEEELRNTTNKGA